MPLGFIIGGHNNNKIRYADDNEVMSGTEIKQQAFVDNFMKEYVNKRLTIICKRGEYVVVSKMDSSRC